MQRLRGRVLSASYLATTPVVRAFERTAGDEVQAVLSDAASVVSVVLVLVRRTHWSVGIGIGAVEQPWPPCST